jgi:hypothetical protein
VAFAGDVASVCFDGRTRRAKVIKVQHSNGYTTEYWHLSSFAPGIEVGSSVSRDPARPIGYAGDTGCVTGPHLHFAVYNPSHLAVDPYAWDPRPDLTWYGRADPWRQSLAKSGLDATSYYLWVRPLKMVALTSSSTPTVIYSTSSTARVTVPITAYRGPLRVELVEGLPSALIPKHNGLHTFAVSAYKADEVPVLALKGEVVIDVRVPVSRLSRFWAGATIVPTLHWWDPEALQWEDLPTAWDSVNRIASAPSSRLGTFALAVRVYSSYLPIVSTQTQAGDLAQDMTLFYPSIFSKEAR